MKWYMGDSLEKGTMTRSSVAMRTPETCMFHPTAIAISVKLVQCDQIYESPTLNKTLGTYLNGYNNHRHYIFRVICIRNLLRSEHSVVLAPSHGHQLSLWLQGIPIMLRIDAHRKGYVTPDMHNVISSSIHSATTKNIVRFVLGCCIFCGHRFERSV